MNLRQKIETLEHSGILEALAQTHGHIRKAAQFAGYPQATFYRRIKQYGLMSVIEKMRKPVKPR